MIARAWLALALFTALGPAPPADGAAAAYFEQVKRLAGRWHGQAWWSTDPSSRSEVVVEYALTGRGSAVVETFRTLGGPSMTSVYHMDGRELRATHFCAAGNQPRLRVVELDGARGTARFGLVDVTNLASPRSGHVSGLQLDLSRADRLLIRFTFSRDGSDVTEHLELQRSVGSAPAGER